MGKIAEKLDIDFIISTGDNFYDDGLTDENDIAFEESFSNIYTARSLQKPWYTGMQIFTPSLVHNFFSKVKREKKKII